MKRNYIYMILIFLVSCSAQKNVQDTGWWETISEKKQVSLLLKEAGEQGGYYFFYRIQNKSNTDVCALIILNESNNLSTHNLNTDWQLIAPGSTVTMGDVRRNNDSKPADINLSFRVERSLPENFDSRCDY